MTSNPEGNPRTCNNPDVPHEEYEEYEYIEARIQAADDPELADFYREMFDQYGDVFATWLYLDDHLLTSEGIRDLIQGDSND